MASKHTKVVTYHEWISYNPLNMRSHDKWKTYLHYHIAYGHQSFQVGDILQGLSTHNFEWSLNEVILWGLVAN